jgi:hypothetical protein
LRTEKSNKRKTDALFNEGKQMTTSFKVPEGHDPFSIFNAEFQDSIAPSIPSLLIDTSKLILTSNPIVRAEALSDGPLTALIMAGVWDLVYKAQKRMLGLFINDVVSLAIEKDNIEQITADFSCIAYSTAVSKALHNDEKNAEDNILGALWKKFTKGASMVESIENKRKKIYELVPPVTTSIVHVFLLNLKMFSVSFSEEQCKALLDTFDFSTFDKINRPFDESFGFLSGMTLPDLLVLDRESLQEHLAYFTKLSCGDFFVDLMDHYEKKSRLVPDRYLYGEF